MKPLNAQEIVSLTSASPKKELAENIIPTTIVRKAMPVPIRKAVPANAPLIPEINFPKTITQAPTLEAPTFTTGQVTEPTSVAQIPKQDIQQQNVGTQTNLQPTPTAPEKQFFTDEEVMGIAPKEEKEFFSDEEIMGVAPKEEKKFFSDEEIMGSKPTETYEQFIDRQASSGDAIIPKRQELLRESLLLENQAIQEQNPTKKAELESKLKDVKNDLNAYEQAYVKWYIKDHRDYENKSYKDKLLGLVPSGQVLWALPGAAVEAGGTMVSGAGQVIGNVSKIQDYYLNNLADKLGLGETGKAVLKNVMSVNSSVNPLSAIKSIKDYFSGKEEPATKEDADKAIQETTAAIQSNLQFMGQQLPGAGARFLDKNIRSLTTGISDERLRELALSKLEDKAEEERILLGQRTITTGDRLVLNPERVMAQGSVLDPFLVPEVGFARAVVTSTAKKAPGALRRTTGRLAEKAGGRIEKIGKSGLWQDILIGSLIGNLATGQLDLATGTLYTLGKRLVIGQGGKALRKAGERMATGRVGPLGGAGRGAIEAAKVGAVINAPLIAEAETPEEVAGYLGGPALVGALAGGGQAIGSEIAYRRSQPKVTPEEQIKQKPISRRQRVILEEQGVEVPEGTTFGEAADMIRQVRSGQEPVRPQPKQTAQETPTAEPPPIPTEVTPEVTLTPEEARRQVFSGKTQEPTPERQTTPQETTPIVEEATTPVEPQVEYASRTAPKGNQGNVYISIPKGRSEAVYDVTRRTSGQRRKMLEAERRNFDNVAKGLEDKGIVPKGQAKQLMQDYKDMVYNMTREADPEARITVPTFDEFVQRRVKPSEVGTTASVPTMITKRMEADLKARGYTEEQLKSLKPEEAWDILNKPEETTPAPIVEPSAVPRRGTQEPWQQFQFAREEGTPPARGGRKLSAIEEEGAKPPAQMTPEQLQLLEELDVAFEGRRKAYQERIKDKPQKPREPEPVTRTREYQNWLFELEEPKALQQLRKKQKGEAGFILIPDWDDIKQAGVRLYDGVKTFGQWATEMISNLGEGVRDYLKDLWNNITDSIPRFLKDETGAVGSISPLNKKTKQSKANVIKRPVLKTEPLPKFQDTIIDTIEDLNNTNWDKKTRIEFESNGKKYSFNFDPDYLSKPEFKDLIEELKGNPAIILEADRQRATGGDMGGPLFTFLKSNQIPLKGPDGNMYKVVWSNMTSSFVNGTKNRMKDHNAKYAIIQVMDSVAHKSNKRTARTLDQLMRESNLPDFEKGIVAISLQNGLNKMKIADLNKNIKSANKKRKKALEENNQDKVAKLDEEINNLIKSRENLAPTLEELNIIQTISRLKRAETRLRSGIGSDTARENALIKLKELSNKNEWKTLSQKGKTLNILDNIGSTFKDRGAAVGNIIAMKFGDFDVLGVLKETADFLDADNLDAVANIELSQNPDFFAVYFGDNPKEMAKMSAAEKKAREALMKDPNFAPHEAYDWAMLGPAEGNNFLLKNPMQLEEIFPNYRKVHPKKSVKNGKSETVAGAMRKYKGVKLVIGEDAVRYKAKKKTKPKK